MRRTISLALLVGISLASGCQSLDLAFGPRIHKATASDPVMEVFCLWDDGEGRGLDGLPARGFGGQIMFFTARQKEAVKVEGDVRIYLFDDQGDAEEQARPIHEFNFTADAWNTYLRPSDFGGTYQLFIPYTRKGNHQAQCTLRVRYTPTGGQPLYSKPTTVMLKGGAAGRHADTTPHATSASTDVLSIPLSRHRSWPSLGGGAAADDGTTTIPLPVSASSGGAGARDELEQLHYRLERETPPVDDAGESPDAEETPSTRYRLTTGRTEAEEE
jgi:hypothetical protein